jgi:Ca2+-binding RTX toxin-like protein
MAATATIAFQVAPAATSSSAKRGNDWLAGGLGSDTIDGGTGLDTVSYSSSSAGVSVNLTTGVVSGGDAAGDVLASIENVIGSARANTLIGSALANRLSGGGGADVLSGKLGVDTHTGGAGNDVFLFDAALGAGNVDVITDFNAPQDTIRLENTGSGLFNAIARGTLKAIAFYSAAGAVRGRDSDDRIIYNTTTGDLYYDRDGSGSSTAVKFATLSSRPAITNADFVVI